MRQVLVVVNEASPEAVQAVEDLEACLAAQGIAVTTRSSDELPSCQLEQEPPIGSCELIVVLGGDGTILRTARVAEQLRAPILGINFGHLGFLANPADAGVCAMVEAALEGRAEAELRANLWVEVLDEEGPRTCFALNEAVVRSAAGRIVDFALDIDGSCVAHMRADGVVVATATGSTAYALSAGGPLVSPAFPGLVVVPLAPHTLTSRALCTESEDVVDVILDGSSDLAIFLDGDALPVRAPIHRVRVHAGTVPTSLLRLGDANFYERISSVFFH